MKCIVINLARSGDRRKLVAEEFDSHGVAFQFSSAKDWLELSELDYENHVDRKSRLMNWNHSSVPGALACWISHQHVWRTCLDNEKLHMVAIFEDDVLLAKQFNLALRALESTRESFDIVFLNNGKPENTFKPLIEISDCFSLGLVKYGNTCQMSFKTDPLLSLKNDPPLRSPSRGSGSVKIPKIHHSFYVSSGSIPEAPALIAGLNNFAVMRQPIQQRSGHLLVTKHRRPFPKGQIRGNQNGHPLVELRDQVKQQLTATSRKWQIPQLVQDHEVAAQQLLRQSPLTTLARLWSDNQDKIQRQSR